MAAMVIDTGEVNTSAQVIVLPPAAKGRQG